MLARPGQKSLSRSKTKRRASAGFCLGECMVPFRAAGDGGPGAGGGPSGGAPGEREANLVPLPSRLTLLLCIAGASRSRTSTQIPAGHLTLRKSVSAAGGGTLPETGQRKLAASAKMGEAAFSITVSGTGLRVAAGHDSLFGSELRSWYSRSQLFGTRSQSIYFCRSAGSSVKQNSALCIIYDENNYCLCVSPLSPSPLSRSLPFPSFPTLSFS